MGPAALTPLGLLAQRADQAEVVERRRPQVVHEASYVGDDVLDVVLRRGDRPLGGLGVLGTCSRADSSWKTTPLRAGPSPSCRSRRIRRRSSSRATTSRSRLSWSSSASWLVRAAVAACRTRSPSSCSSRRDSRLRRPRTGSTTRPTSCAAVVDGQRAHLGRCRAVRRDQSLAAGPVDLQADVGDAEGRRHGVRDGRELLGALVGLLEGRGEAGHHVVRVGAVAEDQSSHQCREPLPERSVEDHGQQQHDEDDLPLADVVVQDGVQARHHPEVHDDQQRRRAGRRPPCR